MKYFKFLLTMTIITLIFSCAGIKKVKTKEGENRYRSKKIKEAQNKQFDKNLEASINKARAEKFINDGDSSSANYEIQLYYKKAREAELYNDTIDYHAEKKF